MTKLILKSIFCFVIVLTFWECAVSQSPDQPMGKENFNDFQSAEPEEEGFSSLKLAAIFPHVAFAVAPDDGGQLEVEFGKMAVRSGTTNISGRCVQ